MYEFNYPNHDEYMVMAKSIVQKLSIPPALVRAATVRKTNKLIQIRHILFL